MACSATQTTSAVNLTGLTQGTTYTYKAYSGSGCADSTRLATASFRTALTVSNLSESHVGNLSANGNTTGGGLFTTGAIRAATRCPSWKSQSDPSSKTTTTKVLPR